MRTVSFFEIATGLFTGRTWSGPDHALERNTPIGHGAIDGLFDHLTQRVDSSGGVVAYDSPRRSELERERELLAAQSRIDELERKQGRAIRELVLNGDEKARERLVEIDAQIAEQREVFASKDQSTPGPEETPV